MSLRHKLNELIDWYEEQERSGARHITQKISVSATANTVRKFARKKRGEPYMYRSREIIPLRRVRSALEIKAERESLRR